MAEKFEHEPMNRYPDSGLSLLIVGGGIAGLAFAIEAHRKGHSVRVIERRPSFDDFGDLIAIQTPALHTPKQWPGFMERLRASSFTPRTVIKKYDGSLVGTFPLGTPDDPTLVFNRFEFHNILEEYARSLDIPIEFSSNAVAYFESDEKGGVELSDGSKLEADIVVAADGVGSKSWKLILGEKNEPVSSGYALYRVSFPVGPAMENPIIAKEFEGYADRVSVHVGPDAHVVIGKSEKEVCWVLTHKDDGSANEEWTKTASSDKAVELVKGWTPFLTELINATPGHAVTDWKLMWRNPQSRWASPMGRVIQIGDSAHSFLPTSGSGATMALEDAYSLASCLQLSGKQAAPLGIKVHNHLRFERVDCAQKTGFRRREAFHKTDWEAVAKNPDILGKAVGDWVLNHDPEKYVYENYGNCVNFLVAGAPFKNTNGVPGYEYKPWTVQELLEASERGVPTVDEGDWS
ncbi:unnamed protein product [Clonostachys byssicola]|uniref:FAD-binding domain-containing protein n=1 Tax=Clonostachys byssicola TaxID=160290 RepID=A0A9N9Y2W1_9HYPO|nr:unnamed protein product [Clonostachys byssicola]